VRKTKLIEGGHHGLQDYRHYVITSTFFYVFFKYVFLPCFVRFLELWLSISRNCACVSGKCVVIAVSQACLWKDSLVSQTQVQM